MRWRNSGVMLDPIHAMIQIAVFYHSLFFLGEPPVFLPNAYDIVFEQMEALSRSGLEDSASFIMCGINGGEESERFAKFLLPKKAVKVFHGLKSRSENLTLVELEKWLPGHEDWYVLYFHAKGCTHDPNSDHAKMCACWRPCMMRNLVDQWKRCFVDLNSGFEAVGCHWMTGLLDGSQNIFGGNCWWAKASFLVTLPSILLRDRIKQSGIQALESRFEAEVWIGNGPRLPKVKDYHPGRHPGKPFNCQP